MTKLYNRLEQKSVRRRLRNEATDAERLLWEKLRGKQLNGLKFRRQFGIGSFIVDFYCPEKHVVIEVDGDSHFELDAEKKDQERTAFLQRKGIHILRFTNLEIRENIEGVIERLLIVLPTL